jgi:hypothetical protein
MQVHHPRWGVPKKRTGFTKLGTLLKQPIPIRTSAELGDFASGFVEMDLVNHSSGLE